MAGEIKHLLFSDGVETEAPSGTTPLTNPMTTEGDIIIGGTSGATTRLAIGSDNQILRKSGTTVAWVDGLATADDPGLVKKNKFQKKKLTANVTTNTTISDLTFGDLVVGDTYEVSGQFQISVNASGSDTTAFVEITHDSVKIARALYQDSDASIVTLSIPPTTFVATNSTVTFVSGSASANAIVVGNDTFETTWAQLREAKNYEETDEW